MSWTKEQIQGFTQDVPHKPGIYIMRDRRGHIVYVGKARDLYSRVIQYFRESGDPRPFVRILSEVLGRLETMVTATEKEALILENELIKKHKPPFNVMLKDDKAYLYLRLDTGEDFPRVDLSRRRKADGALYFGPSHSAGAIRQTHMLVNRHFGLRTCSNTQFRNRTRPCIEWQIKRCAGPCANMVTKEDYRTRIDAAALFLRGRYQDVLKALTERMKVAAAGEDFEEAARLRDQIKAVQDALSRQAVVLPNTVDTDIIGFAREGDIVVFMILRFEAGILQDRVPLVLEDVIAPEDEITQSVLVQYYAMAPVPGEVLVSADLLTHLAGNPGDAFGADGCVEDGAEDVASAGDGGLQALEELLSTRAQRVVHIRTPHRGRVADAMKMAVENAQETLRATVTGAGSRSRALESLKAILGLNAVPHRIEGFDMSTFQAAEPVGSMVVITDGRLDKREYRTFAVKDARSRGDTGFMREVLTRRFARVASGESEAPDVVMLDGGPTQLSTAQEVMAGFGLNIPLVGLAKSRVSAAAVGSEAGHDVNQAMKSLQSSVTHTPERLFVPAKSTAPDGAGLRDDEQPYFSKPPDELTDQARMIVPNQNDPGLHLLMRLRDEAHRFAISYHRKLRNRQGISSVLDGIPGLGKKRRTALLRHFRTVAAIREASLEEIKAAPGLPGPVAQTIFDKMHS